MKRRLLSAALAVVMALSMIPGAFAAGGTAYASTQAVEVDGTKIEFQMYALKDANGNPTNYVKLRDVAHVLNGTKAQFSVGYDDASKAISVTTGQPYTDLGSEMYTPFSGDRSYAPAANSVLVNGQPASLDAISLTDDNGGGYTYFKLRDLGSALGFKVDWDAQRGVIVNTGGAAQPTTPTQPTDPLELFQGAWKGSFQSADGETVSEEIIFTGDQFELAQRIASRTHPTYFRGTVLVQTNMVNSSDGKTYPYVLTVTIKERLNSGTMEPYDGVGYYYIQSVDSDAGKIYGCIGTYDRMNSTDAAALHAIFQGMPPAEGKPPVTIDVNPMDYAYTSMKYLYDHLKFPSTMDIISVRCGQHISSHIFEKTDAVYVVTITYKAANSLGALVTDTYVTMFNLTTGKTIYDAVGYTKSLIDNSWGVGKYAAYSKNTEALGLSGGGTLSTELTREQVQSLVSQIKK